MQVSTFLHSRSPGTNLFWHLPVGNPGVKPGGQTCKPD